jgi:hypothetical protein
VTIQTPTPPAAPSKRVEAFDDNANSKDDAAAHDPFAVFSEWASKIDGQAYAALSAAPSGFAPSS